MILTDRQSCFMFGIFLFSITLLYVGLNIDYLNNLQGWEAAKRGILISFSWFGGAWMMAHALFPKKEDI